MTLLRRLLAMLVMAAYVGSAILQIAPMANAATGDMGAMTEQHGDQGDTMPCKGKLTSGCVTELGCIFLLTLPAPDLSFTTTAAWSSVVYQVDPEYLRGRSIKPALGPPILIA
jgi:hypothetical protein